MTTRKLIVLVDNVHSELPVGDDVDLSFANVWTRVKVNVVAGTTENLGLYPISSFISAKYIITVYNKVQGLVGQLEYSIRYDGTNVKSSRSGKIGNFPSYILAEGIVGSDVEITFENLELFDVTVEFSKLLFKEP